MSDAAPSELATAGGSSCPVCAGRVQPAIDLGDYRLFSCERCGCWCSDAGRRRVETSFTPRNYFAHDSEPDKWRDLDERLDRAGGNVGSVLDVGCGAGAYLAHVRDRRPEALRVGIELDEARAARARELNPGAEIHTGDAQRALASARGGFDLITLWDVFEHVAAPAALLRSLATRLSPQGRLFIQTIHESSAVPAIGRWSYRLSGGRLRAPVRRTHDAHHLVFFTKRGLGLLADAADLRVADQWFDHLAWRRMDGNRLLTLLTAGLLKLEQLFGNGLFVNLILEPRSERGLSRPT